VCDLETSKIGAPYIYIYIYIYIYDISSLRVKCMILCTLKAMTGWKTVKTVMAMVVVLMMMVMTTTTRAEVAKTILPFVVCCTS